MEEGNWTLWLDIIRLGCWIWLICTDLTRMKLPVFGLLIWSGCYLTRWILEMECFTVTEGWILNVISLFLILLPCLWAYRKRQMGGGDLWILAVLCLCLSLVRLVSVLGIGFCLAGFCSLLLLWSGQGQRIPLVPFLGLGLWISDWMGI